MFSVVDGQLYCTRQGQYEQVTLAQQRLSAFQVGSELSSVPMKGFALSPNQNGIDYSFYRVSKNGRWVATTDQYIDSFQGEVPYQNHSELRGNFNENREPHTHSLTYYYDYFENYGEPLNFAWADNGGWSIGSLAFHDYLPMVFFDNSGTMACIWTYNIETSELVKIIPLHEAELPEPFVYQGSDYLLLTVVMENRAIHGFICRPEILMVRMQAN